MPRRPFSCATLATLALLFTAPATLFAEERHVTAVPSELRARLKLAPFYEKAVVADGFPILSSKEVSDYALLEAAYLIDQMLAKRLDIRQALTKNKVRFVIMAPSELTTVVPEHSDLTPAKFWDMRARGLGATRRRRAVSCGEENLLRLRGDPYRTENILIHEFAHAIHEMGLSSVDTKFDRRLRGIYRRAMKRRLWKEKYASVNHKEYWAEAVQSYFDTNRPPDHDHNFVDTREELEAYDPEIAKLVNEVFRGEKWRYVRPGRRKSAAHLEGFDRDKSPKFEWPPALVRWYAENGARVSEEMKKRRRKGTREKKKDATNEERVR